MNRRAFVIVTLMLLLGAGILFRMHIDHRGAMFDIGSLRDVQVLAIGEVVNVDPDREILSLRILDDMAHVESEEVVVVDYSDAEVRYGCEVDFKEGSVMAVVSFGLPMENPLRATRIMCRDCAFKYLIGVEAPPVGESWIGALKAQAG